MSLKHGLLGLLNTEGAMTGYDLDKFFKESLNYFWQAKTSQIYRELSTMESMGWLTSERVLQEEKPNKRVYSITPSGKAELLSWLLSPDIGLSGGTKNPFLMRIFFGAEIGKEHTLEVLKAYREGVAGYGAQMSNVQQSIAREKDKYPKHATYWKLTALSGEILLKAAAEWADKAITILEAENEEEV
ncbi:MAG: PadR family transcriptional regulator [Defluviitaleaceae bacterium]|nr:PadR family transcriptional regulator [Defluviitaleaceae bacterium]